MVGAENLTGFGDITDTYLAINKILLPTLVTQYHFFRTRRELLSIIGSDLNFVVFFDEGANSKLEEVLNTDDV